MKKGDTPSMNNHSNLLQALLNLRNTLPKKQEKLCSYMIENYQSIGLLTIAELAEAANVGTTTVMRLIKNLGYESYFDVKKEVANASMQPTTSAWWHLQQSFTAKDQNGHTLTEVGTEVKSLLDQTVTPSLIADFDSAIQLILQADRINILGTRSNKALAMYLGYLLEEFYPNVTQLSRDTEFIYDRILRFESGDILVLIDNAPFATASIEAAEFCYENNHPVILITDHLSSPASSFASITLTTKASKNQYSVMPTLFLIEALIIEVGRKTSNDSISHLKKLSDILEKKNVTQPFSFEEEK